MRTVKLGWGGRIAMLYIGFVILILILVVNSMRQNFDLVAPDYYQQEIAYQGTIDAGKNQSLLSSPVRISVNDNSAVILFPEEFKGKDIRGTVHFYSPVNAALDREIKIETANNYMTIPKGELADTHYIVKINWMSEGKNYYQESKVVID